MIRVLNVDGQKLTPCLLHRAWRKLIELVPSGFDEQTIQLLYNPFLFRDYRKAALKRDQYTCLWCGRPATTVDHIVPSSKGGSDLPQNLLASCMECNTKRGNRSTFSYFLEKLLSVPNFIKISYRIIKAKHNHRQTN